MLKNYLQSIVLFTECFVNPVIALACNIILDEYCYNVKNKLFDQGRSINSKVLFRKR
jgi:hypothetical protein